MPEISWPKQRTAILVLHGIGSQFPLETLDMFSRTLVSTLTEKYNNRLSLEHQIAVRDNSCDMKWRDNYIRITCAGNKYPIDVYEYYWANLSENVINLADLQKWVTQVVKGANRFYRENESLAKEYEDESLFFTNDGKLRKGTYRFFLFATAGIIPGIRKLMQIFLEFLVRKVPFMDGLLNLITGCVREKIQESVTNVLGDVVVYNSIDPKSSLYQIRSKILNGSVEALKYLIELKEESNPEDEASVPPFYGRIILAGHSLGSQIAFDTINRLTHMISTEEFENLQKEGFFIDADKKPHEYTAGGTRLKNIRDQLCGLVTFGSPLDKIAFFLREQVPEDQKLRGQILENYHCFKQNDWSRKNVPYEIESPFVSIFDEIQWYNFHDSGDPISGKLDYYKNVVNIPCKFKVKDNLITHSVYWESPKMFEWIARKFILPDKPLKYSEKDKKEAEAEAASA